MSKTSKTSGSVAINGKKIASTYTKNGETISDYYLSPAQQKSYEFAQESFAQNLPKINTFSDETVKQMNNQLQAYRNQGIQEINNTYSPMIQSLQENIASRFGNLDNSSFMDNLNKLESKRSAAISDFSQDMVAKQNELINNELDNQYRYLSFLQNYQNQIFSDAMTAQNASRNNVVDNSNSFNALSLVNSALSLL